MDFYNLEADKNIILDKHFTPGRNGHVIDKVVIHHNAGQLTTEGCWQVWQTREASAHYQVEIDGTIGQLVWDRDTAWHAANFEVNCTSLAIEHANNSPSLYGISEATLDQGAHLCAAICRYYDLGRPQWMVNVFPHMYYVNTGCPGSLASNGSQNAEYMNRAAYYYDLMNGDAPELPTSEPELPAAEESTDIDALADAVIRGEYGTGQDRVNALGSMYDTVQNRVNEKLGYGNVFQNQPGPDIDAMADAVIRGEYGNGEERANALGDLYGQVQARVNQKLGF